MAVRVTWPPGAGPRIGRSDVEDACGSLGDGGGVLPSLGPAYSGVRHNLIEADLDEGRTGGANGVVVTVALLAGDQEFLSISRSGPRKAFHAAGIEAGEDGGGSQGESGSTPRRDNSRCRSGMTGQNLRSGHLQFLE